MHIECILNVPVHDQIPMIRSHRDCGDDQLGDCARLYQAGNWQAAREMVHSSDQTVAFGFWWSDRGGGRAALVAKMSGFAGVRFRDHRFLQIMVAE